MIQKSMEVSPTTTNGAEATIELSCPYRVGIIITGEADLLFHRWNCEAVEAKSKAAKGSKAKKSDDIESYLYRTHENEIAVPGEYLRQSVILAAKYQQDPRSPRKSAMDMVKASVINLTPLASLNTEKYDYEHKCRAVVQRNGITRTRPAIKAGWMAEFVFLVTLPEYIAPAFLHRMLNDAGRLVGIGDFRPTYGRFNVSNFEVLEQ